VEQGKLFFRHLNSKKAPKKIFITKGMKIQEFFWMKKPNVNHGYENLVEEANYG
jgi:hypothetical protein